KRASRVLRVRITSCQGAHGGILVSASRRPSMLWLYFLSTGSGLLIAALVLIVVQYRALVVLERIANALEKMDGRAGESKEEGRVGRKKRGGPPKARPAPGNGPVTGFSSTSPPAEPRASPSCLEIAGGEASASRRQASVDEFRLLE